MQQPLAGCVAVFLVMTLTLPYDAAMGEPAALSPSDLARAILFARRVVASVVDDARMPLTMDAGLSGYSRETTILLMAQTILLLDAERKATQLP